MANMNYSSGRSSGSHRSAPQPRRSSSDARNYGASYGRNNPQSGYRTSTQYGRPASQQRRPSSGSYRGSQGRPPIRRRKNNPLKWVFLIGILVIAVIFCVRLFSGGGSGEDRFVENIYINGVSLSGCTREEGYALMEQVKNERLNTEHVLTYGDRKWSFSPAAVNAQLDFNAQLQQAWNFGHVGDSASRKQIVAALEKVPAYLTSELTYDASALDAFIQGIAAEVKVDPVNAEVTLTAEKPVITRQSETGYALNVEKTRENLIKLIEEGTGDTALPVEKVLPDISSVGMEMDIVSSCTTDVSFRGSDSTHNVRQALNYFNAMAVYPGDEISFNTVVGPRTEAAGFRKAPEYAGNETVEGIGGGVCQASTTLYNAIVEAGMEIIERNRHSMTVSYVDPSLDAAVEYGSKDFIFRNETDHTIYIYTEVTSETANVTIYGTRGAYRYSLESIIISEEESTRARYEDDQSGKYVYYSTDPPVLKTPGRGSCRSQGWLVAYDWETGEEVTRTQVSNDLYRAGVNVYWRGVHVPAGLVAEY